MKTKQSQIEKEYASVIVSMLSSEDTTHLTDSVYKLRQLDVQLKKNGLRATINVGTAKIG